MARLEQAQEGLLVTAVEAIRGLPREERDSFLVVETSAGDFLMHPHSSVQPRILASDVDMLARYGLVNLHYNRSGDRLFDVTPEGFEYYEDLRRNADEPVEAIEMTVRRYLDSADFASRHAASYAKWRDAEEEAWGEDTERRMSSVGHHLREAMMAFATEVVERYGVTGASPSPENTVDRLRRVIAKAKPQLGETEVPMLDALVVYLHLWVRAGSI